MTRRDPLPTPPGAGLVVHIDRLVIDGPAIGPGEAARFQRALTFEFTRLAETRRVVPPRAGAAAPMLSAQRSSRPGAGADRVGDLARQVAASLFTTLVEGPR